eukprot:5007754-Alexandrium_andersonii.AAC.1
MCIRDSSSTVPGRPFGLPPFPARRCSAGPGGFPRRPRLRLSAGTSAKARRRQPQAPRHPRLPRRPNGR